MRQHAIPQNILDIEFKLFTKFTVREFVYMAIGIGFGGIFLYFFTTGNIPAIIAIPIFLVSSGIGLFLGLVDINDQKSDIYIRNYFWAITHPTQRVWKNEMIDNKLGQLKPDLNVTQGTTDRNLPSEQGEVEIIGGNTDAAKTQFIEQSKIDDFDREEAQRLNEISQAATQTSTAPTNITTQIPQQQTSQPIQMTQPVQSPSPVQPEPQQVTNQAPTNFRIDLNNLESLTTQIVKQPPYEGNLIFKVVKKDNSPIQQALLVIKDYQGRVVSALQSDQNGEILSNKNFPRSTYTLQFQVNGYTFPMYTLVLDWDDIKPIKIVAN